MLERESCLDPARWKQLRGQPSRHASKASRPAGQQASKPRKPSSPAAVLASPFFLVALWVTYQFL